MTQNSWNSIVALVSEYCFSLGHQITVGGGKEHELLVKHGYIFHNLVSGVRNYMESMSYQRTSVMNDRWWCQTNKMSLFEAI